MQKLAPPPSLFGRDTLLRRLLLLYAAAILAVVLGGAAVIAFAVWPNYEVLERRESDHRLQAVLQAVQSEQDRLQDLVNTNAVWDDPFAFALGQMPDFPAVNFSPDALHQIGVDAVLMLGNDGAELYSGGQGGYAPLLQAMRTAAEGASGFVLAPEQDHRTALLTVGGAVVLVSQRRVVRADGSGPSPAVLIFARRVGPDVLARMRALTGTEFVIRTADEDGEAGPVRAETALADAYGREDVHVAVLGAHDVLAVGKSTITTLVVSAAIVFAVLAALFAAALIYAVVAPVQALREAVTAASQNRTPCAAPGGAPSEIKDLAAVFDGALQLAKSQSDLRNAALAEKQLAEKANEAKSAIVANISHELRTPLNAIIGYSDMMRETAAEDGRAEDAEDCGRILRAAQSLLALINAILDLSKLGAGKMIATPEPFNVTEVLEAVREITEPSAAAKGLKLEIAATDDVGAMHTDANKLQQCLVNLTSNAIKFTEAGGVTLRAGRVLKDGVACVQFEVADTGIGMPPEALKRIFEPFAQADSSISGRFGGTGLGLAITRDLVKLLGGRIGVKSTLGVGTTFMIRVPAELPGASPALRAAA